MKKVSVIVPIYNVYEYIDRCLETVVNQTYTNLEILLIDNNSNNETLEKENQWQNSDDRIVVLKQQIQGLAPTRNLGKKKATGEYITFIDPDDWWDLTIIEKLVNKIEATNADIVMCDRVNVLFDSKLNEINRQKIYASAMFEDENQIGNYLPFIEEIEVSLNGKLYRSDLFRKYNFDEPNYMAEDRAVMHYIFSKVDRVAMVRECLYYYHAFRNGSNVNSLHMYQTMPQCIDYLISRFYDDNDCKYDIESLRAIARQTAEIAITPIRKLSGNVSKEAREQLIQRIQDTFYSYFPKRTYVQYILGSYSLRRAVWLAEHDFSEMRIFNQGSSIISLMARPLSISIKYEGHAEREKWINMDFSKEIWEQINPNEPDVLFVDFLEEVNDIAKCDGSYFTISEACRDVISQIKTNKEVEIVEDSDELWYKACDKFVDRLKLLFSASNVFLIKNKLCSHYGEYKGTTLFLGHDEIRKANSKLDRYYTYFEKKFEGINVIDLSESPLFFTQEGFRFGNRPYHYNDAYYHRQAVEIRKYL